MIAPKPLVYLVDDEPAVLRSVARLLGTAGLRTARFESPQRFLREHDPNVPGCAVVDLAMPGVDGLELQRSLALQGPQSAKRPLIFLTGRAELPQGVAAMKNGAVDFLVKPVDGLVLIEAVRKALAADTAARRELAAATEIETKLEELTPREREVMGHVVTGMLNKQVAAVMGTAEGTIKVHRARVMAKMHAESLAELVRMADRLGIRSAYPDPHCTKV